jgi:cyclase
MNIRIIPRLDIKGPHLVKGIHLEGLRVLGKPEDFARYYYEQGADELIYMDVVASLYERNSLHDIISKTAKEVFIPVTVGGGLRTIDDITNVLRAGADKVALNTAAIRKPKIIQEASRKYGSSTIVVAIEAIKQPNGQYLAFIDNGREYTGIEVVQWAIQAQELGAGELVITSVDREGTGLGFDIDLVKKIQETVTIPVIAHGGAGKKEDILTLYQQTEVSAVALASILHYDTIHKNASNIQESTHREGNTTFLSSGRQSFNKIQATDLKSIKYFLSSQGVQCRL